MTGLVFTISLLAAFQADAALPAASSAMYLSGIHRNGAAIERLRSLLPAIPDPQKVQVERTGASLLAHVAPEPECPCYRLTPPLQTTGRTRTPVASAPIRGPDSDLP